jgi:hypothetical protein
MALDSPIGLTADAENPIRGHHYLLRQRDAAHLRRMSPFNSVRFSSSTPLKSVGQQGQQEPTAVENTKATEPSDNTSKTCLFVTCKMKMFYLGLVTFLALAMIVCFSEYENFKSLKLFQFHGIKTKIDSLWSCFKKKLF